MSSWSFVPGGWRKSIDFGDHLVEVWRFQSVGRTDEARHLLMSIWSWAMDGVAGEQEVRIALRLLDRVGFLTDAPAAWDDLPADLVVYRAESQEDRNRGLCWTLDRSIAEMHAGRHGLDMSRGSVKKADVLAYITGRGEDEIVARRENIA